MYRQLFNPTLLLLAMQFLVIGVFARISPPAEMIEKNVSQIVCVKAFTAKEKNSPATKLRNLIIRFWDSRSGRKYKVLPGLEETNKVSSK
jgi:hypothetical protein